jgi:hypothetical protein
MIPSTMVSGVVQSLIFLATLKFLGVALDSLALIPGIFINGIVAVFMVVPLTGIFLYGLAMSFGAAALGTAVTSYITRRITGPKRATVLPTVSAALIFAVFNGLMLFLARSRADNPLGLAPKSAVSYSMAYVSLMIGALVNAGIAMLVLSVGKASGLPDP